MKKLMTAMVAAVCTAAAAEYATIGLTAKPQRMTFDAKAVALDVVSTDASAAVTANVVRVVTSWTNCQSVALVTNYPGSTTWVTNRWMGMKERKAITNLICGVTCEGGAGRTTADKFILAGDEVIASGITNLGETVEAKLIIEK